MREECFTVRVKVRLNEDSISIIASGHADYGEYGKDIVCSAVSALFMSYTACLRDVYEREMINKLSIEASDGKLSIDCGFFRSVRDKSTVLAYTYFLIRGLGMIAKQYPENLKTE